MATKTNSNSAKGSTFNKGVTTQAKPAFSAAEARTKGKSGIGFVDKSGKPITPTRNGTGKPNTVKTGVNLIKSWNGSTKHKLSQDADLQKQKQASKPGIRVVTQPKFQDRIAPEIKSIDKIAGMTFGKLADRDLQNQKSAMLSAKSKSQAKSPMAGQGANGFNVQTDFTKFKNVSTKTDTSNNRMRGIIDSAGMNIFTRGQLPNDYVTGGPETMPDPIETSNGLKLNSPSPKVKSSSQRVADATKDFIDDTRPNIKNPIIHNILNTVVHIINGDRVKPETVARDIIFSSFPSVGNVANVIDGLQGNDGDVIKSGLGMAGGFIGGPIGGVIGIAGGIVYDKAKSGQLINNEAFNKFAGDMFKSSGLPSITDQSSARNNGSSISNTESNSYGNAFGNGGSTAMTFGNGGSSATVDMGQMDVTRKKSLKTAIDDPNYNILDGGFWRGNAIPIAVALSAFCLIVFGLYSFATKTNLDMKVIK